jgi:hypothetical protein
MNAKAAQVAAIQEAAALDKSDSEKVIAMLEAKLAAAQSRNTVSKEATRIAELKAELAEINNETNPEEMKTTGPNQAGFMEHPHMQPMPSMYSQHGYLQHASSAMSQHRYMQHGYMPRGYMQHGYMPQGSNAMAHPQMQQGYGQPSVEALLMSAQEYDRAQADYEACELAAKRQKVNEAKSTYDGLSRKFNM